MGCFLTGHARIQQTDRRRLWKLSDNELFKDSDGTIYMAPRNMPSDCYTIPLWIAWIAGSPIDFDTRGSHIHDQMCYNHEVLIVDMTEEELKEKKLLRYSEKNKMWVCEDVPVGALRKREVSKKEANDILYRCMESVNVPLLNRIIIRIGVVFNVGWFFDKWFGKVFSLDFDRVYEEAYWRENLGK